MSEEKKNTTPAKAEHTAVKKVDTQSLTRGQKTKKWFRDMKGELKKVIWPTRQQTMNNTGVALTVMAISAVVFWGFDKIAQSLVQALITLVG